MATEADIIRNLTDPQAVGYACILGQAIEHYHDQLLTTNARLVDLVPPAFVLGFVLAQGPVV